MPISFAPMSSRNSPSCWARSIRARFAGAIDFCRDAIRSWKSESLRSQLANSPQKLARPGFGPPAEPAR